MGCGGSKKVSADQETKPQVKKEAVKAVKKVEPVKGEPKKVEETKVVEKAKEPVVEEKKPVEEPVVEQPLEEEIKPEPVKEEPIEEKPLEEEPLEPVEEKVVEEPVEPVKEEDPVVEQESEPELKEEHVEEPVPSEPVEKEEPVEEASSALDAPTDDTPESIEIPKDEGMPEAKAKKPKKHGFNLMGSFVPSPEQIKEKWNKLDYNGNGILSLAEIDMTMVDLFPKFGEDKPAIIRAYKAADASKDGWISRKEFKKLCYLLGYYDELYELFKQLDNGDRRLAFNEFKKGHDLLGLEMTDEELQKEFDAIDLNHGGWVLFEEFCIYMAKKGFVDADGYSKKGKEDV